MTATPAQHAVPVADEELKRSLKLAPLSASSEQAAGAPPLPYAPQHRVRALASSASSYASHESLRYRVHGESGWIGMDPAFSYDNLRTETSSARGEIENRSHLKSSPKNQFALEMDHFGECVLASKTPYTPGEEGLQDQRLIEAIYESANTGKPVRLLAASPGELDQFRGSPPQS